MENTIHTKLVKIQQELKAPKSQRNEFGGFNYRSCEDILNAVKPLLGDLSLTLSDDVINVGDRNYIQASAILSDGKDSIVVTGLAREAVSKTKMDDAQITGAASSYARKYALNGLFAIDDTKDADTQDNTKVKPEPKVSPAPTDTDLERRICNQHDEEMVKKYSESKKKDYWCHRNEAGKVCFGSGYLD